MRKLLNTLYVTTPDAYLSKDGLNVVVSVKQVETFPYVQSQLLARFIREDLNDYPVFLIK